MTWLPTRDLAELIAAVTERTRIPDRILEKDYWATEVLRDLVADCGGTFLFKGGTSLSKAYRLLDRCSEDLDLLVLADAPDLATVIARARNHPIGARLTQFHSRADRHRPRMADVSRRRLARTI